MTTSNYNILIADDKKEEIEVVSRYLIELANKHQDSLQILSALSGFDALVTLSNDRVDVLFLDYHFEGGISGDEIIDRVFKRIESDKIIIVLMSGYRETALKDIIEKRHKDFHGRFWFIRKPIDPLAIQHLYLQLRDSLRNRQNQQNYTHQKQLLQNSSIQSNNEPLQVTMQFSRVGNRVRITWNSSVIGTTISTFSTPYVGPDLELVIRALDALQYPNYPLETPPFTPDEQARLKALGVWETKGISRKAPQIVGKKLYAMLRRSQRGAETLKVVREAARSQGRPVSYILRFPSDSVELAALPWEVLWDERQAVLLARGGREIDSCERYLDLDMALSPPLPSGKTLRVLALSPQAGIPQTIRDEERVARLKSWERLKEQGLLEWDEISPVTPVSLDNWMRQNVTPDIVHYYGHGIYKKNHGYLLFDSHETPGQHELVSEQRLAAILGGIRLIMMFACQSAMAKASESNTGLLTGIAPALSVVSEVVVAMQLTTRISAATRFSEVFYEELARGRSVQAAVAESRRSLYVTESDGMSWYVPTLYIRTRKQEPIYFIHKP